MNKKRTDKFVTFILASIPCFILIASDGSFMVQSIILPILFLLLYVVIKKKIRFDHVDSIAVILHLLAISVSSIVNILFFPDLLSRLYVIRIFYFIVVLIFYYCSVGHKFDYSSINTIFEVNILMACYISLYFIFVEEIWFVNFVGDTIDKNFSAGLMALQGELALIRFFESRKLRHKLKYIILYTLILYGVFLSHSRASMLAILGGSVLIFYDCFLKIKHWEIKHVIKRGICILTVLILLGFILVPNLIHFLAGNNETKGFYSIYFNLERYYDRSNQLRLIFWERALKMWTERPIFGHGIGAVYVGKQLSSAVAHNTFLDYLVDQGLIGFTAFLLIIYQSFRKILHGPKKKYRAIPITLILLSIVVSATRSVMLWNFLIICRLIGNCNDNDSEKASSIENMQVDVGREWMDVKNE